MDTVNLRRKQFWQRISPNLALTVIAFVVWLWIRNDYGITWDEPEQCLYGEAVRNYYFGSHNLAELNRPDLPANATLYGPFLSLVCATISHATGADIYSVRHNVQGLLWVAMFYPICALGRRLSGRPGSWCAGLALLGMPALLGHAFNNPKDLPLACAGIWMLHASVSAAAARRLTWSHALKLGAAVGFVLAMRPGAWFLCGPLALPIFASGLRSYRRGEKQGWLRALALPLPVLLAALAIGWTLMVLPWPNALHSPFAFPVTAARYAMHFDAIFAVLFGGHYFASNHLPWDYLLVYIALTQPLPLLMLAIWGHRILWQKMFFSVSRTVAIFGIVYLFWFPLTLFILLRPNIYDGMRHFLFVLPPLAVFAGIAAADLVRRARRQMPPTLVLPAVLVLLLSAVPSMVRLHPYENVYYNFLAGPRDTLSMRYETDYWLSSYREAASWLNQHTHNRQPLSVALASSDPSALPTLVHFLAPGINVTPLPFGDYISEDLPTNFTYYVANCRRFQTLNFSNDPVVDKIAPDGIVLTVIRENRRELTH